MASDGKVVICTELDNSGIEKGIKGLSNQMNGLEKILKNVATAVGAAFAVDKIVDFAVEASEAARTMSDALTGLRSILEGQGRSFSEAQAFIEEYTQDGLIPAANAITAYKNLASRGYDDSQIRQVMNALKDASTYGRQASMTMGEAVESATEGLKNENSILVDNAGVTKNVAKMWDEYAKSIGTTANNLTQQQKIQAEVAGILEESKYQAGDAATVAGTLSGQLQQLSYRFNDLKVAVGNAINPIAEALLPIINTAITELTKFVNAVASVVGALFGKATVQTSTLSDSNASVAKSASDGAKAEKKLEKATTAAGKAAKKTLASFDELNVLQSGTDSSAGGSSASGATASSAGTSVTVDAEVKDTLSPKLQAIVDKIRELIEPLKQIDFSPAVEAFGRLKEAVEPLTKKLFEGLEWAWYNILVPLAKWTIEDLLPAFLDLVSAALDVLNVAIEGLQPLGEWLWTEFLRPIAEWTGGVIVDILNAFADALTKISDWISEHQEGINNFVILLASIAGSFGALTLLSGVITLIKDVALLASGTQIAMSPLLGTIMAWATKIGMAFSNVGTWITGTLVPAVTTALGGIASALGISVGWVAAIGVAVGAAVAAIIIYWDEIVTAVQVAWENIKAVWATISTWFDENVIQPLSAFFAALWESITVWAADAWEAIKEFFTPAFEWFGELFGSIRQTISDVFYNIGVIASGCWEIIKAVWGLVSDWFNETVIQPVAGFFAGLWEGFTNAASQAWEAVKEVFGKVAAFFKDVFSDAWEGVVAVFSVAGEIFTDIKDGILTAFKKIVNSLIGGINSVVRIPFDGINTALGKIRDIEILGLTPFSNLKTISVPQIPKLAQGAVLPANKPFLAMVGDQKHGTNVEAPLSTIEEAVQNAMARMGAGANNQEVVEVLRAILQAIYELDTSDERYARAVRNYNEEMAVVRGGAW